MKSIIGQAGTGKTRALLEYAKEIGAVVVCQNPDGMRVKAQNYGIYRMDIYGYDQVKEINPGDTVVIDEMNSFFKYWFDLDLQGFNSTEE